MNPWTAFYVSTLIRGMDKDMNIKQKLSFVDSMYETVTKEDIFNKLKWNHLCCLIVDGVNDRRGIKKGFVGQVKQMCNAKNIPQPMFLYCIIHQEALHAKYVDINSVLNPVVKMMKLIKSPYTVQRHVERLSRAFELKKEIGDFLESKGKP
ncbi:uncharacterized protein TNCV_797011 [Trichonephila clavipes]|uniref:Uncharacterized protein n=1 Tax=Trichonephila clavipes TaxID=2585209 RepID=A0A8X6WKA2_TRICX|nr:uncharacterized protein TNCV_797011 [Trichonephila clavipes]